MPEPRGIRNNNPLNIRQSTTAWLGLAAQQRDTEFCTFDSPEYGIRAAARILSTYQERYGINTLSGVIHRWAPPSENDTSAYVASVSIWADILPDAVIDLSHFDTCYRLLRAMTRMENGHPPEGSGSDWYSAAVWERGLRLAGLAPTKPLVDSRTMRGTAAAGAGITAAIGVLTDQLGLPAEIAQMLPDFLANLSDETTAAVVLFIALAGAAYAALARHDDKRNRRL